MAALLAAPAFGAAALAVTGVPVGRPAAAQQPSGEIDARELYLRDCATCHDDDGRGTNRGPSLVGDAPAYVDYMLRTGRMPMVDNPTVFHGDPDAELEAGDPAYPPEVIAALVAYVEAITGGGGIPIPDVDPQAGDLALGGELFRLECAACHIWSGTGGALLYREAPAILASDARTVAEAIRIGPGTMPAFGEGIFDEHELNSVVAYVEFLQADEGDPGGHPLAHLGPLVEGAVAMVVGFGSVVIVLRWMGTARQAGEDGR